MAYNIYGPEIAVMLERSYIQDINISDKQWFGPFRKPYIFKKFIFYQTPSNSSVKFK